jgi:cytochrome c-type biogenesis protein
MGDLTTPGTFTAFAAGIVSFLSPCVLPLVPGYVSYVAGGLLMVVLGVAMITGWLNAFSFWLIDTFPVFRAMG